jgi:hypothetical protein
MSGPGDSKATVEEVEARAAYWDALAREHGNSKLGRIASRRAHACRMAAELMRRK